MHGNGRLMAFDRLKKKKEVNCLNIKFFTNSHLYPHCRVDRKAGLCDPLDFAKKKKKLFCFN